MKYKLTVMTVLCALALVQATLSGAVSVYGVSPSLVFIAVYALSITGGEWEGILFGGVGGLAEDLLSGGFIGLSLSGYALAGYLAGRLGRRVYNIGEAANFGGIFLLSLIAGAYTAVVLGILVEGYGIAWGIWRFALPQAAYNALAGVLLLWLFRERVANRVSWMRTFKKTQSGTFRP